jgi:hypothetical protein
VHALKEYSLGRFYRIGPIRSLYNIKLIIIPYLLFHNWLLTIVFLVGTSPLLRVFGVLPLFCVGVGVGAYLLSRVPRAFVRMCVLLGRSDRRLLDILGWDVPACVLAFVRSFGSVIPYSSSSAPSASSSSCALVTDAAY